MSLAELLVKAANRPDATPFTFDVGQVVRVRKNVTQDGQTPRCWAGAQAKVLTRKSTMLYKRHYYTLEHLETGAVDEFEECEIDARFRRKQ